MATLSVKVPDELDTRFRQAVFQRKGMKKGNIAEAVAEALQLWVRKGDQGER